MTTETTTYQIDPELVISLLTDEAFHPVEPTTLEETGLKAASCCCNTHWAKPLSHPDANVRREGVEGVVQALKDAKRYGASSVLLVPGRVTKEVNYDDCFKRSVDEIRKILPTAEELGVKLAIENVWNDFITKADQAMAFLEAIDSPMVGWHFDIGNVINFVLKLTNSIWHPYHRTHIVMHGLVPAINGDFDDIARIVGDHCGVRVFQGEKVSTCEFANKTVNIVLRNMIGMSAWKVHKCCPVECHCSIPADFHLVTWAGSETSAAG